MLPVILQLAGDHDARARLLNKRGSLERCPAENLQTTRQMTHRRKHVKRQEHSLDARFHRNQFTADKLRHCR